MAVLELLLYVFFFLYFFFSLLPESELSISNEQSAYLDMKENNEINLAEAIFTVLSYCTLSPKSLGDALQNYMEKEHMWDFLHNISGKYNVIKCFLNIIFSVFLIYRVC